MSSKPSTARDPRWVSNGWGYSVKSQDALIRAIGRIGTLQVGRRYVGRGVSNFRWRVRSSLVRSMITNDSAPLPGEAAVRGMETALLREARSWGIGLDMGGVATDLYMLAYLQHHGIPTRLLDVTSNPMTALWFACQRTGPGNDTSGALMAFDVTGIPQYPTVEPAAPVPWSSATDPLSWSLRQALATSFRDSKPFLVRPTLPDARMQAQEGLFISGVVPENPAVLGVDGFPLVSGNPPGPQALEALFATSDRSRGRPRSLPFCVLTV